MEPAALDSPVEADWMAFVICFEAALDRSRRSLFHPHRAALKEWHGAVIRTLSDPLVARAIASSWPNQFGGKPGATAGEDPSDLLRKELRTVTAMLADATGMDVPTIPGYRPWNPPDEEGLGRKLWKFLNRPIGVKDAVRAAETLFGSLKDLCEANPWLKALFLLSQEAAATVTE